MIAKKPPLRRDGGSSIYYLISYICNDDKTEPDLDLKGLWFRNLAGETVREVVVEMRNIVDFGWRETLNPLVHYVITWPQDETPPLKQIEAYGDYLLKALHLENNQAVMALHQNTKNDHLHIVANRIGFDGRPVRLAGNGWDVKAAIKAMRELEQMYGLKVQHNGIYDTIDGEIVDTGKQSNVSVRARDMEA